MGQPFVDASSPLLQIQGGKRGVIDLLQSKQNIPHFALGVADDAAIRLATIQASPELHPHRFWLIEDIFQRNGCSPPSSYETEPEGMRRIGQKEVISQLFQENQMRHGEIMS